MKLQRFEIENFKGVQKASVGLEDGTPGNVGTLIGLNESGKTTILEALSHFGTEDKETASLVRTVHAKSGYQDLIPQDRKAAFTGNIHVKSFILLDDSDIQELSTAFQKRGFFLDLDKLPRNISVARTHIFDDSTYKSSSALWAITFHLKKVGEDNFVHYDGVKSPSEDQSMWLAGVNCLDARLPRMVYFPTFLFNFPERIYLSDDQGEINLHYRNVIQDVLDSQGKSLSLERHVVGRINRLQLEHPNEATFMSFLSTKDEKRQIDAVLQKAANEMSRVIFGSWNEMFRRTAKGKRIDVDWSLDHTKKNAIYLQVSIIDGGAKFSLAERSLGFRWFFSFLLFTQFRSKRNGSTIFLFDEPAANLHSRAQIKLLETFGKIAQGTTHIIYSTHSHYMVNPKWLEKAYIVENEAGEDEPGSFKLTKNNIKAVKYKTFVGSNPTKTSYFQPVLDALEVTFSPLVSSSEAIIVEGKHDYFPLRFLRGKATTDDAPNIFPVGGASHAGTLINLFRGWGTNFKIILDDDQAGRQAKSRYIKDFLVPKEDVITLGDIDSTFQGKAFESVYQKDVIDAVKDEFNVEKPSKAEFSLHFQRLTALASKVDYPDTEAAFKPIASWISMAFKV